MPDLSWPQAFVIVVGVLCAVPVALIVLIGVFALFGVEITLWKSKK